MGLTFFSDVAKAEFSAVAAEHRLLVDALSRSTINTVIDLGSAASGVSGARLASATVFDRVLSGWVFGQLVDGIGIDSVRELGIWNGREIDRIGQFNSANGTNELLCFQLKGGNPKGLEIAIQAVKSFDPAKFDSDGYVK